jgi:F0F1-type ATP synthase assembly protein I
MSTHDNPDSPEPTKGGQKVVRYTRQAALAMELPFTMAGTVIVGGFIGYLLDKWLHTSPWLMSVLGAVGFIGGLREVIRRVQFGENGNDSKSP